MLTGIRANEWKIITGQSNFGIDIQINKAVNDGFKLVDVRTIPANSTYVFLVAILYK